MEKALGLVETRGLVGAIEAADAMLKNANVNLAGKEKIDPAMITIMVTGEVASVRAAVDAGAAAAQRVGQFISAHVIPEPDDQLSIILPEILFKKENEKEPEKHFKPEERLEELKKEIREEAHLPEPGQKPSSENISQNITKIKDEVEKSSSGLDAPVQETSEKKTAVKSITRYTEDKKNNDLIFTSANDTISRLRDEAFGIRGSKKAQAGSKKPEVPEHPSGSSELEPTSFTDDYLLSLNVHLLRKLARSTKNFPIRGREISKANRQELLDLFNKLR